MTPIDDKPCFISEGDAAPCHYIASAKRCCSMGAAKQIVLSREDLAFLNLFIFSMGLVHILRSPLISKIFVAYKCVPPFKGELNTLFKSMRFIIIRSIVKINK